DDGVPDVGHPRPDDHDRPVAALGHRRGEGSGEDVGRTDVHREGGLEVGVGQGDGVDGWAQGGVVHDRVEPSARCLGDRGGEVAQDVGRGGQVGGDEDGLRVVGGVTVIIAVTGPGEPVDLRDDCVTAGRVATGDDYAPALGGEGAGCRGADAAGGAGDE